MAFPGAHAQACNFRPSARSGARTFLEGLAGQEPRELLRDDVSFVRGLSVRAAEQLWTTSSAEREVSVAEDDWDGDEDLDRGLAEDVSDHPLAFDPSRPYPLASREATSRFRVYQNSWAGTPDYLESSEEPAELRTSGGALAALRARVAKLAGVSASCSGEPDHEPRGVEHSATSSSYVPSPLGKVPSNEHSSRLLARGGPPMPSGTPARQHEEEKKKEQSASESNFLNVLSGWSGDAAEGNSSFVRTDKAVALPSIRPRKPVEEGIRNMKEAVQSSSLLAAMRKRLAEERIDSAPSEYVSFCKFLEEEKCDFGKLAIDEVCTVPTFRKPPTTLDKPYVVEAKSSWAPRRWTMAYWSYECGEQACRCFPQYPPTKSCSSSSTAPHETMAAPLQARVDEFTKYVGVLRDLEASCNAATYLAYPRFFVGGWSPFAVPGSEGRTLWEEDLRANRQLWTPNGIQDQTPRWVKLFCRSMKSDWREALASMDRIQIGPAGAISSLHVENARAHAWFGQIQGRRAFVLFPPGDSPNLSPEGISDGSEDRRDLEERTRYSALDVLRPSKAYKDFKRCHAHVAVLQPGQILVLPEGWWVYSVTLDPSVTLHRRFWNATNKRGICEELEAMFREQFESLPEEGGRERLKSYVDSLKYKQEQDYSSDED